jgi:hypothetical protein
MCKNNIKLIMFQKNPFLLKGQTAPEQYWQTKIRLKNEEKTKRKILKIENQYKEEINQLLLLSTNQRCPVNEHK